MPVIDSRVLTELVAEVHTNMIMKRSIDHRALEVIAVGEYHHGCNLLAPSRPIDGHPTDYFIFLFADSSQLLLLSSASVATCITR